MVKLGRSLIAMSKSTVVFRRVSKIAKSDY